MSKLTNRPIMRKARNDAQRNDDMVKIAKLVLQKRFTVAEIAEKLGLTESQVQYDLKEIREAWKDQLGHDIKEVYSKQLATLDLLEAEAWESWETSKADNKKGNINYWRAIMQCWEQRNKIMGFGGERLDINMNLQASTTSVNVNVDYTGWSNDDIDRELAVLDEQLAMFEDVGKPLTIDAEFHQESEPS